MTQSRHRKFQGSMTRRDVLQWAATAAAGAAATPFLSKTGHAQVFNWQRFRGKELYAIFIKHPWTETLMPHFGEFEALTGIKIKPEILPDIQARQKLTVELTAGSGGLDTFLTSPHVEKRRFSKAGWYEPLNRFLNDPTLTAPEFDWADFTPGAKGLVTLADGTITALPCVVDPTILYYRKDLFQQKGLKVPKTLEEFEAAVQTLHNPPSVYGLVARGLKNANVAPFSYVLYAYGGEYLTADRKSALNTPAWIKAVDWYAGMVRRYAPPGAVNYNWYECSAAFMQGTVGMYFDGSAFAPQFQDPQKSKIVGNVGNAVLPAGPAGLHTSMFSLGMAVSAQSKNREAAWLFVQWAVNKQNCVRELLSGLGSGRASTWSDPEVKAKGKMPADWYTAFQDSLKVGRNGLPEIVDVTQCRDIVGLAIQKAIEGAKPADVMAQAHKEFQDMLDSTEK